MPIYNMPHAGTKVYRTKRNFRPHKQFSLSYGEVFPVTAKFVLPGDVWKISAGALIRMKPMLAPTLTRQSAFFRFFFVPLRQVVENLEEIVTGSKNGALITSELPKCKNFVKEFLDIIGPNPSYDQHCFVHKNSFWAALGVRPTLAWLSPYAEGDSETKFINYDSEENASDFPAAYWYKAYCKIIWEYFRDENYQSFDGDFEKFYEYMLCNKNGDDVVSNAWFLSSQQYAKFQKAESSIRSGYKDMGSSFFKLWVADIRKDYFMSSLPWILKGAQPTINTVMHVDFSNAVANHSGTVNYVMVDNNNHLSTVTGSGGTFDGLNNNLLTALNKGTVVGSGFTANDVRDMFAETRVFERLARCGSRYVEYLESNFGIAPRDDTLQRPLYLGGFEQPLVTTEVVQTGGSDNGDVGTLRGHGISSGGNRIKPFVATEFGMVFGLMYITPQTQYLYQTKRELTYKSRFDFVNPSFQLLSEQEVSNVEFFTPMPEPTDNNVVCNPIPRFTLGFQGMYNELRYDNDIVCRDLADTDAYWTQSLNPGTWKDSNGKEFEYYETPPLNGVNINLATYINSLLKPFAGQDGFKPFIVDYQLNAEVWRPLVKDPIPSLTDHN